MKIPHQFIITTKEYIQIQTKLNLYIAKFGCKMVEAYLDAIPLRMYKKNGRNAGAYIVNKVCQQYQISQYELFESNSRHEITEARQILCVLVDKYLGINQAEIASQFHKSRHFAKRMIGTFHQKQKENHPFDRELLDKYNKLDALVGAYIGFEPKPKK